MIHLRLLQNRLLHLRQTVTRLRQMYHSDQDIQSTPDNYENILVTMCLW